MAAAELNEELKIGAMMMRYVCAASHSPTELALDRPCTRQRWWR
jgi:hypothetical protein